MTKTQNGSKPFTWKRWLYALVAVGFGLHVGAGEALALCGWSDGNTGGIGNCPVEEGGVGAGLDDAFVTLQVGSPPGTYNNNYGTPVTFPYVVVASNETWDAGRVAKLSTSQGYLAKLENLANPLVSWLRDLSEGVFGETLGMANGPSSGPTSNYFGGTFNYWTVGYDGNHCVYREDCTGVSPGNSCNVHRRGCGKRNLVEAMALDCLYSSSAPQAMLIQAIYAVHYNESPFSNYNVAYNAAGGASASNMDPYGMGFAGGDPGIADVNGNYSAQYDQYADSLAPNVPAPAGFPNTGYNDFGAALATAIVNSSCIAQPASTTSVGTTANYTTPGSAPNINVFLKNPNILSGNTTGALSGTANGNYTFCGLNRMVAQFGDPMLASSAAAGVYNPYAYNFAADSTLTANNYIEAMFYGGSIPSPNCPNQAQAQTVGSGGGSGGSTGGSTGGTSSTTTASPSPSPSGGTGGSSGSGGVAPAM